MYWVICVCKTSLGDKRAQKHNFYGLSTKPGRRHCTFLCGNQRMDRTCTGSSLDCIKIHWENSSSLMEMWNLIELKEAPSSPCKWSQCSHRLSKSLLLAPLSNFSRRFRFFWVHFSLLRGILSLWKSTTGLCPLSFRMRKPIFVNQISNIQTGQNVAFHCIFPFHKIHSQFCE